MFGELGLLPTPAGGGEHGGERWERTSFLLSSRGTSIDERILRTWFIESMKLTGCPMNGRQYRQYYGGVVKNFLPNDIGKGGVGGVDLLHAQSGHSTATGNETYGVAETDMRKLDATLLDSYMDASEVWHRALNIVDETRTAKVIVGNGVKGAGNEIARGGNELDKDRRNEEMFKKVMAAVTDLGRKVDEVREHMMELGGGLEWRMGVY